MTSLTRIIALLAIVLSISLGVASVAISSIGASRAQNSVALLQSLIVQGKTAGARDSKTTAQEVQTLLSLQRYDHQSTVAGQKEIQAVIAQVEAHIDAHLDATIAGIVQKYYANGAPGK